MAFVSYAIAALQMHVGAQGLLFESRVGSGWCVGQDGTLEKSYFTCTKGFDPCVQHRENRSVAAREDCAHQSIKRCLKGPIKTGAHQDRIVERGVTIVRKEIFRSCIGSLLGYLLSAGRTRLHAMPFDEAAEYACVQSAAEPCSEFTYANFEYEDDDDYMAATIAARRCLHFMLLETNRQTEGGAAKTKGLPAMGKRMAKTVRDIQYSHYTRHENYLLEEKGRAWAELVDGKPEGEVGDMQKLLLDAVCRKCTEKSCTGTPGAATKERCKKHRESKAA
mmetsp:Transcript_25238/g.71172  ORF Transcript_25238/g.71172 Transcript_25238/m.71172 type:complete len:278 (-) Transcript_25238:77-910(-)